LPINVTDFCLELISKKSVSCTVDEGAIELLNSTLSELGFKCNEIPFSESGTYDVNNIYASYTGGEGKKLCFAGHTDVVPEGNEADWSVPPFLPQVNSEGVLIGRGAVDMKGSIAAFVSACSEYLEGNKNFNGSISFLITGDMMKVGRRGSITFELTVEGIQGHVAYPDVADNPNHSISKILADLSEAELDEGTEFQTILQNHLLI